MQIRLTALIIFYFLFLLSSSYAQIYVKSDASGLNDGSSWENAYNDLQDAIINATPNTQIWIAAGTYTPAEAGASSTATFYIDKPLEMYGGFNGTEESLAQRDLTENITKLSGDLLGDDLPDEDSLRKNDNVFNVITLDSTIRTSTILDGLHIENGYANGNIEDNPRFGRGGGIFTYGAPLIQHCVISHNFSRDDGGGVYLSGLFSSGAIFIGCDISHNISRDDGGGLKVFAANGPQVQFIDCEFVQNQAQAAGGGLHVKGTNALIKRTRIENNTTEKFGGGIDIEQSLEFSNLTVEIDSCTITRNICRNIGGGILYFSDRSNNVFRLLNSDINNNNASVSGGGVYLQFWIINEESQVTFSRTSFTQNNAVLQSGGGIFYDLRAISSHWDMNDCLFRENTSALEGGAIMVNLQRGEQHKMNFTDCVLEENVSNDGGGVYVLTRNRSKGALNIQHSTFLSNNGNTFSGGSGGLHGYFDGERFEVLLNECRFERNEGRSGGGAYVEVTPSSGGSLFVRNSAFINNDARNFGGAISYFLDGGFGDFSIENSQLGRNSSGIGGGISYRSELGGEGDVTLKGSSFIENTAFGGAGGMLIQLPDKFSNTQIDVDSCLFEKNVAEQNVGGLAIDSGSDTLFANINRSIFTKNQAPDFGAMYIQQTQGERSDGQINIANSLFTENSTFVGAAIGIFAFPVRITNCTIALNESSGLDLIGESELIIQNNIFHNPNRFEFRALDSLGTVISLGGNLSSDVSMGNVLGPDDLQEIDPLLIQEGEFSYRLSPESPALDAGLPSEESYESDLAGNPRIQGNAIDIGAFEGSFVTSIIKKLAKSLSLTIYPNPIRDVAYLRLNTFATKELMVQIVDNTGKVVYHQFLTNPSQSDSYQLSLKALPTGNYHVLLTDGNSYWVRAIQKL